MGERGLRLIAAVAPVLKTRGPGNRHGRIDFYRAFTPTAGAVLAILRSLLRTAAPVTAINYLAGIIKPRANRGSQLEAQSPAMFACFHRWLDKTVRLVFGGN